MGIWSGLDDITLFRYEQATYEAERHRRPRKDAPWYRQHVSESISISWVALFSVTLAVCIFVTALLTQAKGAAWWAPIEQAVTYISSTLYIAMAFFLVWIAMVYLKDVRKRALARWARVAPFRNAIRRRDESGLATARHALALRREQPVEGGTLIAAMRVNMQAFLLLGAAMCLVNGVEGFTGLKIKWASSVALVCAATLLFYSLKKGQGSAMARQRAKRCPHCDYDLSSAAADEHLAAHGVDAGPGRCTECGLRYPLVPPAMTDEVAFWDRRARRGSA
ncbi:MAG TPA: hypothetical protein VK157_06885 [Phycisphaerales bacterium]|nr:hypothetical protein [Phycisphaerales bacterium]